MRKILRIRRLIRLAYEDAEARAINAPSPQEAVRRYTMLDTYGRVLDVLDQVAPE